jgi:cellulose biosynthesis protein BcsQ
MNNDLISNFTQKVQARAVPERDAVNNYDPPISRKLMERLCGLSTNTLIKYEAEGLITPKKVRYGGLEMVTYTVSDVHRVFGKRGVSFKKKESAEVIAVFSQKGGVGKSSFVQHLASTLSLVGRCLVIDVDSQSDATSLLGLDAKLSDVVDPDAESDPTIIELMDWELEGDNESPYRKLEFEQVVRKVSPTLHVIPGDLDLGEINYSLNRLPLKNRVNESGEEEPAVLFMIKNAIDKIKHNYDFILFDCPPNIETCNVEVLFASNRILIPLELEAKCLKTMRRNENFLKRLMDLHPGFHWDKILVVPNKFRRENIKIKALAKLQDLYFERADFELSQAVFPLAAMIDKCADAREPVFVAATRYGKEFRSSVPQAKEFTDLFWIVMHELLDLKLERLIFSDEQSLEV